MEEGRKHASSGEIALRSTLESEETRDQNGWIILVSISIFSTGKSGSKFEYSIKTGLLQVSNDTEVEGAR